MNSEQIMRLQFLDEAREYIDAIETGILALDNFDARNWEVVLRAAHSIKGGAAMMGYPLLSEIAHRLEDYFKILNIHRHPETLPEIIDYSLKGSDCLRRCVEVYQRGESFGESWLEENLDPITDVLGAYLGELQESTIEEFSANVGEDMVVFLFQTEVESCLQRLEAALDEGDLKTCRAEFRLAAQELEGLGQMVELPNFSLLCERVAEQLKIILDEDMGDFLRATLQEWRRAQALVFIGQADSIPSSLNLSLNNNNYGLDLEDFNSDNLNLFNDFEDNIPDFSEFVENDVNQEETIKHRFHIAEDREIVSGELENNIDTTKENIIRVSSRPLEELADLVGELTIERNGLNLQLANVKSLFALLNQRVSILKQSNQNLRALYDGIGEREQKRNSFKENNYSESDFDRLEMDRYTEVHSVFQELIDTIVQIQEVTGDIDINLDLGRRAAGQITRTSRLLQEQVTRIRMKPFSELVARLPRALREMSLKYGKNVNLQITGETVLLDRPVIDSLADPLFQLVRNAFDHGIEDAATRRERGKPEEGTISLSAVTRGGQTIITIEDDGAGIDLDKIAAQALKMGLTAEDLEKISRQDLLNFIFEPGFSTAGEVTELSGRGVGMDIVKTRVAGLKGQIQIDSRIGRGTKISIFVPYTLTVLRVLLVRSAGLVLAFPTGTVEEMFIPTEEQRLVSAGKQLLTWNGELLPSIVLRDHFHFSRSFQKPETGLIESISRPVILIVSTGERRFGLEVDGYFGEQEITLRSVEGDFPLPKGFNRCTILGDGQVVPLIAVDELIDSVYNSPGRERSAPVSLPPRPTEENVSPLLMVVDDSINVRRFVASTLEKAGYRVVQAKDGQEALEKLAEGLPIRAVICDIEMPRLDGYGFLAHVRGRSEVPELPVLMLTSRSGDKHRQLALNLGASAYFAKPFSEPELLATLKSLTSNV